MKNQFYLFFSFCMILMSCISDQYQIPKLKAELRLSGNTIDTVFLYTLYKDNGATVFEDLDHDGVESCRDNIPVKEVYTDLNTNLPGKYNITYSGQDSAGNRLKDISRVVVVKENSSTFLNGNYNVTCTCSAVSSTSSIPVVTKGDYRAVVSSSNRRDGFELSALEIGGEVVVPSCLLLGDSIQADFYSPNFQLNNGDGGHGRLFISKDTFTIETLAYSYQPVQTIRCKNVYSKQIIIQK